MQKLNIKSCLNLLSAMWMVFIGSIKISKQVHTHKHIFDRNLFQTRNCAFLLFSRRRNQFLWFYNWHNRIQRVGSVTFSRLTKNNKNTYKILIKCISYTYLSGTTSTCGIVGTNFVCTKPILDGFSPIRLNVVATGAFQIHVLSHLKSA